MTTQMTRSAAWAAALPLLAASLLAGCNAGRKTTCGPGTELVAFECVPLETDGGQQPEIALDASVSCGDGTYELDGVCQVLRPIGAACEAGAQCLSGSCLSEEDGVAGGYCTIAACSPNRPCPAASHCRFSSQEGTALCLALCNGDEDCREGEGYVCQPLDATDLQVCTPSCTISETCPHGARCDEESGKCTIHACVPGADDACGEADTGLFCYPDVRGLTTTGGVCLPLCDPEAPSEVCASNEVCQPLPGDSEGRGICVTPVCATTEDCPAGAQCMDGACHPPARCDETAACADETLVCVDGPGGQCMPRCPEEGECADIHSGLSCSAQLQACLPTGSFPGGVCRSDLNDPCDDFSVEGASVPMVCRQDTCFATCAGDGDVVCGRIHAGLTCAENVLDVPACLELGRFPGSPCGESIPCNSISRDGLTANMICLNAKCAVACQEPAPYATGDGLCGAINPALACVTNPATDFCAPACVGGQCPAGSSCLQSQNACLPTGSFLGSPCAGGTTCNGEPNLVCVSGVDASQCLPGCDSADEAGHDQCLNVGTPFVACVQHPDGATLFCHDGS